MGHLSANNLWHIIYFSFLLCILIQTSQQKAIESGKSPNDEGLVEYPLIISAPHPLHLRFKRYGYSGGGGYGYSSGGG
jgi:hypothetical protein